MPFLPLSRTALLGTLLLLGGCAIGSPSEQTRFYRLQAPAPVLPDSQNLQSPSLAILPVQLPAYLDRVSLVVQASPVRVEIPQLEQWAGNLRDDLQLALLAHLSQQLNNPNLLLQLAPGTQPDQTLQVEILRFDGQLNKDVTLSANWTLTHQASGKQRRGRTLRTQPVQPGYEGLVEGMSALVEALARDIGPAIR